MSAARQGRASRRRPSRWGSRDDLHGRRLGSEQIAIRALVDVGNASGLVLVGEVAQRQRGWELVVEHELERGGQSLGILGRYEDAAAVAECGWEAVDVGPDHGNPV